MKLAPPRFSVFSLSLGLQRGLLAELQARRRRMMDHLPAYTLASWMDITPPAWVTWIDRPANFCRPPRSTRRTRADPEGFRTVAPGRSAGCSPPGGAAAGKRHGRDRARRCRRRSRVTGPAPNTGCRHFRRKALPGFCSRCCWHGPNTRAATTDKALATLQPYVEGRQLPGFFALQAALIGDQAGRTAFAATMYDAARVGNGTPPLRLAQLIGSFDARTNHQTQALQTLDGVAQCRPAAAARAAGHGSASRDQAVATPLQGMAEALVGFAAALHQDGDDNLSILMLRMALSVRSGPVGCAPSGRGHSGSSAGPVGRHRPAGDGLRRRPAGAGRADAPGRTDGAKRGDGSCAHDALHAGSAAAGQFRSGQRGRRHLAREGRFRRGDRRLHTGDRAHPESGSD